MQRTFLSAAAASTATAPAAVARRLPPAATLLTTSTALCAARRWRSTDRPAPRRGAFVSAPSAGAASPYEASSSPSRPQRHGSHGGVGRGPMKDRLPPVPTDLADPRRRLAVLVDGSNPHLLPTGSTTADQIYRTSALFRTVLPAVLQVGVPVLLRVFAHQLPAAWETLLAGSEHGAVTAASAAETPGGAARPFSILSLPSTAEPDTDANASSSSPSPAGTTSAGETEVEQPRLQLEYFRVERFIPVAMQIEADARHIYELRTLNKVEGVCYVCHEVDRALYVSLMQEQRRGSAGLADLLYPNSQQQQQGSGEHGAHSPPPAAFFNQYVLDELGMADELLHDPRSKDGS